MIKTSEQMCLTVHPNSVTKKLYPIQVILNDLAAGENCDGEPYDQMVFAANLINELLGIIKVNCKE